MAPSTCPGRVHRANESGSWVLWKPAQSTRPGHGKKHGRGGLRRVRIGLGTCSSRTRISNGPRRVCPKAAKETRPRRRNASHEGPMSAKLRQEQTQSAAGRRGGGFPFGSDDGVAQETEREFALLCPAVTVTRLSVPCIARREPVSHAAGEPGVGLVAPPLSDRHVPRARCPCSCPGRSERSALRRVGVHAYLRLI